MSSNAMDISDGDGYLHLPPVEDEDSDNYMHLELQEDYEIHEDFLAFTGYIPADLIAGVGVGGAPDDSQLALAVSDVLKTVEAPSSPFDDGHDCPICLEDDDAAVWKETPCGHPFHGRCVERWLHAKGSCPMCRRQVVVTTSTAADGTNTAENRDLMVTLEELLTLEY